MKIESIDSGAGGASNSSNPKLFDTPYDFIISNKNKMTYLCIGDSLTEMNYGYHQVIEDNLRNIGIGDINIERYSRSGYKIADIYGIIDAGLDMYPDAQIFTILLGTNDTKTTLNAVSLWTSYVSYIRLIEKIKKRRPNAEIRICQIPWIRTNTTDGTFLPSATWETNKNKINKMIRSLSRRYGMPYPPDLYEYTKNQNDYYIDDGLHFSYKGYRQLAPIFLDLLKQRPNYTADRHFLTGMAYKITGGSQHASYADDGFKLTRGKLETDIMRQFGYSDYQFIAFNNSNNGGMGGTINVDIEFTFGAEVILNDVCMISGCPFFKYSADTIKIYSFDGAAYKEEGVLNNSSEGYIAGVSLDWFSMFCPDQPIKTKGLKISYSKTFSSENGDWFMLGEISATKLDGIYK